MTSRFQAYKNNVLVRDFEYDASPSAPTTLRDVCFAEYYKADCEIVFTHANRTITITFDETDKGVIASIQCTSNGDSKALILNGYWLSLIADDCAIDYASDIAYVWNGEQWDATPRETILWETKP
jgi:hypothetical protein